MDGCMDQQSAIIDAFICRFLSVAYSLLFARTFSVIMKNEKQLKNNAHNAQFFMAANVVYILLQM